MTSCSKPARSIFAVTILAMSAFHGSGAHRAEAAAVDQVRGSYQDAIAIPAPPFAQIGPGLKLAYGSTGGIGQLGVGWSLAGVSYLERVSPGRGAPRYDASDGWLLDGMEIIDCNDALILSKTYATSCWAGGTHTTKIESYFKITKDGSGFTVLQKNGTSSRYQTALGASGAEFRYYLSSVADTHGNRVDYKYWADGSEELYLDTIEYNGTTIQIFRESRPDPIVVARGLGKTLTTRYRVNAIEVRVGSARRSYHKIAYKVSACTGRSLIVSVTPSGTDPLVSLPAITFDYVGGYADAASPNGHFLQVGAATTTAGAWGAADKTWTGDFNGDGKTDVATLSGSALLVKRSTGTSFVNETWSVNAGAWGASAWVGDFNGDGKADLATAVGGTIYVKRSTGTAFVSETWTTLGGSWGGVASTWVGDFNGDGLADIATFSPTGVSVKRSTGAGFVDEIWESASPTYTSGFIWAGDFNGDGRTDIAYLTYGTVKVLRSMTYGFTTETWLTGFSAANADEVWAGDFNGDGKTDLAAALRPFGQSPQLEVELSSGSSFLRQTWFTGALATSYPNANWAMDVDGDGRTDIVSRYGSFVNGQWKFGDGILVSRATGSGFSSQETWSWPGSEHGDFGDLAYTWAADFDGDGRSDLASGKEQNIWLHQSVYGSQATGEKTGQVDLVSKVGNGLGATTTFEFVPSSYWPNTNNPPIQPTVKTVTMDDGRGHAASTRYAYAGGYFDQRNRQFVGFGTVTESPPALPGEVPGPSTQTAYKLDTPDGVARPTMITRYDALGRIAQKQASTYAFSTTVPYRAFEHQLDTYVYGPAGDAWKASVTRTFDCYTPATGLWSPGYGNLSVETHWGDMSGAQAKTISYAYAPNASAYIVGKPRSVTVFPGTTLTVTPLSQTLYAYDGATSSTTPPTRGDLTKEEFWLDRMWQGDAIVSANAYVANLMAYDAYGNIVRKTTPATAAAPSGATTTTVYDATYHQYPVLVTNALGHAVSSTWDYVRGVKLTSTKGAGATKATTSFFYDSFARDTKQLLPTGAIATVQRVNEGSPTTGYEQVDTPGPTGGTVFTRVYKDGLGRVYRTMKSGASAGAEICADDEFDARGNPWRDSLPFPCSAGAASAWNVYTVDGLNRTTKVTAADGSVVATSYGLGTVTVTDPGGHQITRMVNSLGQLTSQTEWEGADQPHVTTYGYDALGRKTSTTDPRGNVWSSVLDSFGRALQDTHPDRGTVRNEFDSTNHVTVSTNAAGEQTRYTYDLLGRLVSKTTRANTPGAEIATFTYDEARAGYFNEGVLTTFTDPSRFMTTDYDSVGNKVKNTRVIGKASYTQTWGYDGAGRVLYTTLPDGEKVGTPSAPIRYDAAGRLLSVDVTSTTGQVTAILKSASYDDLERPVSLSLGNNTSTTYKYSATRGWVDGIVTLSPAATRLQDLTYLHDVEGQVTSILSRDENGVLRSGESWDFGYDSMHRLTRATPPSGVLGIAQSFAYDELGNMTFNSRVGTYSYGDAAHPHAVTSIKPPDVIIGRPGGEPRGFVDDGVLRFSYDAMGRLTDSWNQSITWNGSDLPASIGGSSYTYDAFGTRLTQTTSAGTTTYLGDDYEVAPDGKVTKYIVVGGTRLAKRTAGVTTWLHTDRQGTVQLMSDASGKALSRASFGPYGEPIAAPASGALGYTGQRQDDNGLLYLHARYYDPMIGRFISPDPTTPSNRLIGLNAYAYAANNPIAYTDIDGHGWFSSVVSGAQIALSLYAPGLSPVLVKISSALLNGYAISQAAKGGDEQLGRFLASVAIESIGGFASTGAAMDGHASLSTAIEYGTGFVAGIVQGDTVGEALKGVALASSLSLASSWLSETSAAAGTVEPAGAGGSPASTDGLDFIGPGWSAAKVMPGLGYGGPDKETKGTSPPPEKYEQKVHPAPKDLPGFPGAKKIPNNVRDSWKWGKKYLQWDYQHGKVELWDKSRNNHLGERNVDGSFSKDGDPKRRWQGPKNNFSHDLVFLIHSGVRAATIFPRAELRIWSIFIQAAENTLRYEQMQQMGGMGAMSL